MSRFACATLALLVASTPATGRAASMEKASGEPLPEGILHRLGSPWLRSGALVVDLAIGPGGDIVALDGEARITVWSGASGAPVAAWSPVKHRGGIWHDLSADGSVAALVEQEKHLSGAVFVTLWSTKTGKRIARLENHPSGINDVAVSPDGKLVATADTDDVARIWDVATGKPVRTLKGPWKGPGAAIPIPQEARASVANTPMAFSPLPPEIWEEQHVVFSPDGARLATTHAMGRVRVWDVATGDLLVDVGGPERGPAAVFLHGGDVIAHLGEGGEVRLHDVVEDAHVTTLDRGAGFVMEWYVSLAASPDGKTLAAGTSEAGVCLWDLEGGGAPGLVRAHGDRVEALAFSPDGRTLATGARDRTIGVWDTSSLDPALPLVRHFGWVTDVAISPDGRTAATAGEDARVHVWDLPTGVHVRTHHSEQSFRRVWMDHAVEFSPDGETLYSASTEGDIVAWKVATGEEVLRADSPSVVADAALSPDGGTLALVGAWGSVTLVSAPDGQVLQKMPVPGSWGYHLVEWLPDGETLVSTGMDCHLRFWNPETGKLLQDEELGHTVYQLVVPPEGGVVLVRSHDAVHTWRQGADGTWSPASTPRPAPGDVAVSPDGARAAAVTKDGAVVLRNPATWEKIATLPEAPAPVTTIAFSPDGALLLGTLIDSTVVVWDTSAP